MAEQIIVPSPGLSDRYFLIDPDHAAFVDGRSSRLTPFLKKGGCTLFFLIPFILVGIFLVGMTLKEAGGWYWLQTFGQTTTGCYEERWIKEEDESSSYYTSYTFTVNNIIYQNEIEDRNSYRSFGAGEPVEVLYWGRNPAVATLAAYHTHRAPFFCLFSLVWNGFIGFAIINALGVNINEVRLNWVQEKTLLVGSVVEASGREDSENDFIVKITVRVRSAQSGRFLTAHAKRIRNDLTKQSLPQKEKPVLVLYASDTLYQIM